MLHAQADVSDHFAPVGMGLVVIGGDMSRLGEVARFLLEQEQGQAELIPSPSEPKKRG